MFVKQKFCFFVNNNDTMLCKTMKTLLKYSGIFYFKKQLIWVYFVTVTGQNRQRLWKKNSKTSKKSGLENIPEQANLKLLPLNC